MIAMVMKICMFTNTYFPHVGGVARSVATFAEDLRNAGHRVLIVAPDFSGTHERRESEPDVIRVPAIQEAAHSTRQTPSS